MWINLLIHGSKQGVKNLSYAEMLEFIWSVEIILKWLCETHWHEVITEFKRSNLHYWLLLQCQEMTPSIHIYPYQNWHKDAAQDKHLFKNWVLECQAWWKQLYNCITDDMSSFTPEKIDRGSLCQRNALIPLDHIRVPQQMTCHLNLHCDVMINMIHEIYNANDIKREIHVFHSC